MNNNWHYYLNDSSKLMYETDIIIKKSIDNRKNICSIKLYSNKDVEKILQYIFDEIYEYDQFYSLTCLLKIISYDNKKYNKIIDDVHNKLINNIRSIYSDNNLYLKISEVNRIGKLSNVEQRIINKMIDYYSRYSYINNETDNESLTKIHKIIQYRNSIEDKINYKVDKNIINENNMIINYENYKNIVRNTHNPLKRKEIYKTISHNTNNIIKDFAKLLICKHEITSRTKKCNFGIIVTKKSEEELLKIRDSLKEIVEKLKNNFVNAINTVQKELNILKVHRSDILYYIESNRNDIKISVMQIIPIFIEIINNYYGLMIEIIDNNDVWNDEILTARILNNKNDVIGYFYMDLTFKETGRYNPYVVKLGENWNYPYGSSTMKLPFCILLGNYKSLTNKILNYTDAVNLFKQFGIIVHLLCNKSKLGFSDIDNEYKNVIANIFEYTIWDEDMINKIVKVSECKNTKGLYKSREIEIVYKTVELSIMALFDNLITTSNEFIGLCKNLIKDEDNLDKHIKKIYNEVYSSFINISNFDYNDGIIDPEFVNYLFGYKNQNNYNIFFDDTNSCGLIYNNVKAMIIASNMYQNIKKTRNGNKYTRNVLESSSGTFDSRIKEFFINENIGYACDDVMTFVNDTQKGIKYK